MVDVSPSMNREIERASINLGKNYFAIFVQVSFIDFSKVD